MALKREKDRWGNEEMLSMPRILWQMATFRTEELRMSEVMVGCYFLIFCVLGAAGLAFVIWFISHLRWVP